MKKENAFYHCLFKKATAFRVKTAAAVVFVMLINMLSFPVFNGGEYAPGTVSRILEVENKLGKIYGIVNLPVHILNEIFHKEVSVSGIPADEKDSESSSSYALFVPAKKGTKKAGEALSYTGITGSGSSGCGRAIAKNGIAPPGILNSGGSCILNYLESNDTVRYALLFLMLLLSLPRGIPLKLEKYQNINLHFPSLFIN